jgi:hypothetical protein
MNPPRRLQNPLFDPSLCQRQIAVTVQKESYFSNAVEGLDVVTLKVLRKRSQLQVIQAYSRPRVLIMKSSENFLLQEQMLLRSSS